ncbi:hypothetical protein M8C21_005746, partial [Ambrosia artemisiifolia]
MTSQQRGTSREQNRESTGGQHGEGQPEHIRSDVLRLRGRQAITDLLMRVEREWQRELQGLTEYRAVSDFAHRKCIQGRVSAYHEFVKEDAESKMLCVQDMRTCVKLPKQA